MKDISHALDWLEGCLKSKAWNWDGLQREAAEKALADARKELRALPTVDVTNHHNALLCSYCNPRGAKFEENWP